MARSLSNMLFKGIASSTHSFKLKAASGSGLYQGLKFSTKITGDSDTHEDFRPTSNLQNSGITVQDVVMQDVKENPVMLYIKGTPDAPRCGFSALAVKVLQQYQVPISARNILENPQLKEGVKAFSNWPTFPQIFIKGEFIGGSDIVLNMHQNGQLKDLLNDINANSDEAK